MKIEVEIWERLSDASLLSLLNAHFIRPIRCIEVSYCADSPSALLRGLLQWHRPHILDYMEHWRDRAAASRALAEHVGDATARELMILFASNFDRIAEQTRERAETRPTPAIDR